MHSQIHYQEAGLEVELWPVWDAGTEGGDLLCCATAPALKKFLVPNKVTYLLYQYVISKHGSPATVVPAVSCSAEVDILSAPWGFSINSG